MLPERSRERDSEVTLIAEYRWRSHSEGNQMASKNRAVYALKDHYEIQGHPYELLIYRVDNEFYASWSCEACATRGETDLAPDREIAKEVGVAVLKKHHAECHAS
jgi:hypothetical protein